MKKQCLALSVLAAISCGAWASVPENNTDIMLQGFQWTSASTSATWYTQVQANADDENSFENQVKVVPSQSDFTAKSKFDYQAQAMSLTVIRIKTKTSK